MKIEKVQLAWPWKLRWATENWPRRGMETCGRSEGSRGKHCKKRDKLPKPPARKKIGLSRPGKRLFE